MNENEHLNKLPLWLRIIDQELTRGAKD